MTKFFNQSQNNDSKTISENEVHQTNESVKSTSMAGSYENNSESKSEHNVSSPQGKKYTTSMDEQHANSHESSNHEDSIQPFEKQLLRQQQMTSQGVITISNINITMGEVTNIVLNQSSDEKKQQDSHLFTTRTKQMAENNNSNQQNSINTNGFFNIQPTFKQTGDCPSYLKSSESYKFDEIKESKKRTPTAGEKTSIKYRCNIRVDAEQIASAYVQPDEQHEENRRRKLCCAIM